jgi:hypothetical protein
MQIELCDWEQNGYHDSYFYSAVFDTETGVISSVETGATAYAGGMESIPHTDDESILHKAYEALEVSIRKSLLSKNTSRHTSPDVDDLDYCIRHKSAMVTTKKVKCAKREKEDCRKCSGTGHWQNPRKESDKRSCFSCDGRGYFTKTVKGDDGKNVWVRLDEGTEIIPTEHKAYGKFYDNGYNKPNRENTTVTGLLDGEVVTVKLANLKLAGEEPTEEMYRKAAHRLATEGQFQSVCTAKCAWLSKHYAPCPDSFMAQEPLDV